MAVTVPPFPIARFSVEQYHHMIKSGAFTEDDRIELIEGWVVEQMAKGPAHEYTTGELVALLQSAVPSGLHVRNQAPITFEDSEPEPDISVVRGSRTDYRERHPGAQDVALVVEVSDTTLATDLRKARTYAAAQVPEYWIVDLPSRAVLVFRHPDASLSAYRSEHRVTEGDKVVTTLAGEPIEVTVRAVVP